MAGGHHLEEGEDENLPLEGECGLAALYYDDDDDVQGDVEKIERGSVAS